MEVAPTGNLRLWIDRAQRDGARWMMVVHGPFGLGDYAVCLAANENPRERLRQMRASGNEVHEVYDLTGDIEAQLNSARAWSIPEIIH